MVIDTHVHFYDPSRPQGVPWPRPEDSDLYRPVLPEHAKAVAVPTGVGAAIAVEASPWIEDNAWLLELAENEPFVVAVVGNLSPGANEFACHLARFAAQPLFRGIRQGASLIESGPAKDALADLHQLAERGLVLDLLVRPRHLAAIARLAQALPELRIVINHIGCAHINGAAADRQWAEGMRQAAACSNVSCKVSALPTLTRLAPAPTNVEFYTPILDVLWTAFGPDRLLYGSDWPVCRRHAEYGVGLDLVTSYVCGRDPTALDAVLGGNAERVYRGRRDVVRTAVPVPPKKRAP